MGELRDRPSTSIYIGSMALDKAGRWHTSEAIQTSVVQELAAAGIAVEKQ